jgi:quercetin dioxygenase-like cupin family protein
MRRIALLAVLGSLGILAIVINAGTSLATGSSGFTTNYMFRATLPPFHSDSNDYKLFQKDSQDVVMRELTMVPGGNTGWHFHPGPTYVLVVQGTDSLYEATDPTCTATNYGPGEGFVEPPGDVHISRNEGSGNLVLLVTFLDVPVGGAFRLDAPRPGNCPF